MVGIYGIYFELSSPGAFFPGVLGGICLLLGLYALHTLSAGYAGLLLILLALVLFFAELKVQSHGLLLIGGIVSMFIGSLMLFDRSIDPYLRISWPVLIGTVAFSAVFFGSVISLAVRSQFKKPETGSEGMVGEVGEAVVDFADEGKIFLLGEFWNARCGCGPLRKGDKVVVKSVDGMTLVVEPYISNKT
jgi:membrane-bound serine protease (ClpP class)